MSAVHADEVKNPAKSYPKAILISVLIILTGLIFSSLAIAMVVPLAKLNVVTGLEQAFMIFFADYHLSWMLPVIIILIVLGGIGGVATWIIGPTKGLLVAVEDGSAPAIFAKTNRPGVPVVILLLQAVIFTLVSSVFLLEPTVAGSYWVLTAMTAQLAMLFYIAMFLAAIKLRSRVKEKPSTFQIPGGKFGLWLTAGFGLFACVSAIIIGFIPPGSIDVGRLWHYELIMVSGLILLCLPPVIIFCLSRRR